MNDVDIVNRYLGGTEVRISERAAPVPGDLRSEWRVALVLLLLGKCHGASATLEQLHMLNSASLFEEASDTLVKLLLEPGAGNAADRPLIRYEPALSRAVDISVGVNLAEWSASQRLRMTSLGREAHRLLAGNVPLLSREKKLLARIPGRVSHASIERILARRR